MRKAVITNAEISPADACVVADSPTFQPTRFQGSKRKIAAAIIEALSPLEFDSVLDAFGGTGAVSHSLKRAGKKVTYNDVLHFNHEIGLALIENDCMALNEAEIACITQEPSGDAEPGFIEKTFEGIYFTTAENRWLDGAVTKIRALKNTYRRAMAWYALFQSALIKRPYNLFHRGNLYMRTANVPRSFGNKVTWDRPFEIYFERFAKEGQRALIDSEGSCQARCGDASSIRGDFDLVYIDPPYFNKNGVGVNYQQFYHFLEGLVRFDDWPELLDQSSKHLPLKKERNPWSDPLSWKFNFEGLLERFEKSTLAVSYRSDGIPQVDDLRSCLARFKNRVRVLDLASHQYALSTNRKSREVLIVGC